MQTDRFFYWLFNIAEIRRETPEMDFRADAVRDYNSRKGQDKTMMAVTSWEDLEGYLGTRGVCSKAVQVGRKVWQDYLRWEQSEDA
jgi:hypothetical protein